MSQASASLGEYDSPLSVPISPVATLFENFEYGCNRNPNAPFLGFRLQLSESHFDDKFSWISYSEIQKKRNIIGSFIMSHFKNLNSKGHIRTVGIYSVNRVEWVITEQACNAFSLISVALCTRLYLNLFLDDTLGRDTISYIINHSTISIIFTSKDKLSNILAVSKNCPCLKLIVCMEDHCKDDTAFIIACQWAFDRNIQLITWSEAMNKEPASLISCLPPKPSDIASICYTSGTTGIPKGVILTHRNYISAIPCVLSLGVELKDGECHISYLPLAHCFERAVQVAVIFLGGSIGFYCGDVTMIMEDMKILKPTLFISVPRLFNKIYTRLVSETINASGVRGFLFKRAFASKKKYYDTSGSLSYPFWDSLLFSKVAAVFGGRIKYIICGSAPINPTVLQFFRIVLSAQVFEGYGATESSACGSITLKNDPLCGSVGFPTAGGKIRLIDVPELNYYVTDKPQPRGEILIKGPFVFEGYYKDPEMTASSLTSDNWLLTGDIGIIDENGRLHITDRKKHVFKLAQGEYIAPEKLEKFYSESPLISQIFIDGNSLASYLIAIVVPNVDQISPITFGNKEKLESLLLSELQSIAQSQGLQKFEYIQKIYIEKEPFSIENELLTPTLKLKRHLAKKRYGSIIDSLYSTSSEKPVVSAIDSYL